jgi:hypothetical protein
VAVIEITGDCGRRHKLPYWSRFVSCVVKTNWAFRVHGPNGTLSSYAYKLNATGIRIAVTELDGSRVEYNHKKK